MNIGILGGGQLARMLIESCEGKGYTFHVMTSEKNSPAGQITGNEFIGDWNNEVKLKEFAEKCDFITLENEFIDFKKINFLESLGSRVNPSSEVIRLVQDKFIQKDFLNSIDVPVASYISARNSEDVISFAEQYGYPVVLKSRTMGYDGKGNYLIRDKNEIDKAIALLSSRGELMCEAFIDFEKELAVQAVRSKNGEVKIYPVVETIQKDHICHLVKASKEMFVEETKLINRFAEKIINELNYVGVLGIEMFLLKNGSILVNELAPRVHNSGHHTIESCNTSQFKNHINAVIGFAPGDTSMKVENAVMINILGRKNEDITGYDPEKEFEREKDAFVHMYGKTEDRTGRKMGHITLTGYENISTLTERAIKLREKISL